MCEALGMCVSVHTACPVLDWAPEPGPVKGIHLCPMNLREVHVKEVRFLPTCVFLARGSFVSSDSLRPCSEQTLNQF